MQGLVWTRGEAAGELKIGIDLLDQWLSRRVRPIPHYRDGRKIFIPKVALEAWVIREADEQTNKASA